MIHSGWKLSVGTGLAAFALFVLLAALFLFLGLEDGQPKREVALWVGGSAAFFFKLLFVLAHVP